MLDTEHDTFCADTTINNTNIYDAGFVENFNVSDPVKHVAIITQEEPNIQETPSSTEELGSNSTTNDHIINVNHNGTKAIAFGFLCVFVAITVMATKIQNDEYWYLNAHSVKMVRVLTTCLCNWHCNSQDAVVSSVILHP